MAISTTPETTTGSLQELAKRHLWMHFTRMGAYADSDVPIIVRGEGPYVYDEHGNRYLDGLSGLFCSNAGHGRTEIGEAAARQVEELDFITLWSYAHPRAIELAARIASLAPGDLNRVFFTSGGSEAVESAIKLVPRLPPAHRQSAEDEVHHPRDRLPRHHAGRARRDRHHRPPSRLRAAGAGWQPRAEHERVSLARRPRPALGRRPDRGADPLRGPRDGRRRDPRAAPERGWLHPAAGGLLPAGARDLRPPRRAARLRRGHLLVGPPGPLLRLRALRLRAGPDHHGEGADLGVRPDGRADRLGEGLRAVRARHRDVHPRLHLRRPPRGRCDRDGQPRRVRARGPLRPRPGARGRAARNARRPARHPDRRRRARRRLLPRDRAGEGPGHEGGLLRRRVRVAPARVPLRRALPPRAHLPRGRPGRPRRAAGAAADLRPGALRGDREHPPAGPHRGSRAPAREH